METTPQVVDLLISFAKAALQSEWRFLIFVPYPAIADPTNPWVLALNPWYPEYEKVWGILENFPTSEEILENNPVLVRKQLWDRNPLSCLLLDWIIVNNGSNLIPLDAGKQLKFMKTPHQYIMKSNSPAKEAIFAEAKRKYGSVFAFHGSRSENWHLILKNGLLCFSGTSHQLNGSIHGAGIYLSVSACEAFTYSRNQMLRVDRSTKYMALCEAITSPELAGDPYTLVMPKPEYVLPRFLFAYKNNDRPEITIDTREINLIKFIESACEQLF